ncbi:MAG: acyltransferase family protein [Acidimicrobiia bacterium]|nr:acyltransferase family protein [Acidimicrobiia bacterium]
MLTTPRTSAAAPRPVTAGRVAALDGLRGFALIGMLAWHAELTWVRGGFARMTIFFVLAGFLAGASLRRSYDRGDPRAFRTFWGRRARRLLPVTLLGVAWAVVVTALVGGSHARETVLGDALATMGSVANWRFLADDRPYGAMLESGTAFQHYWSLSLEEQAFLLLPGILAVVAFLSRGSHAAKLWILAALGTACAAIPLVIAHSPDAAYYGTHVRLGEFLFGVLLAEFVARRPLETLPASSQRWIGMAGAAGLAALVATMAFIDRDNDWLYSGGLGLFAIPTVAVLAATLVAAPLVTAVLSLAPLVALGRWALSVYVLHWPLYQLLDDGRIGLDGTSLALVQIGISIIVGGLCFYWIEQPLIRAFRVGGGTPAPTASAAVPAQVPTEVAGHADSGSDSDSDSDDTVSPSEVESSPRRVGLVSQVGLALRHRPGWALLIAIGLLAVAALLVPSRAPEIDFEAAEAQFRTGAAVDSGALEDLRGQRSTSPTDGPPMTGEEALDALERTGSMAMPVFRFEHERGVAVYGGSGALTFGVGTFRWSDDHPVAVPAIGWAGLGCGLLVDGERSERTADHLTTDELARPPENCQLWEVLWPASTIQHEVDVAVVFASTWDLEDWVFDGDDVRRSPGDPVFDAALRQQVERAVDLLRRAGASEVVLVTPPPEPALVTGGLDEYQRRAGVYMGVIDDVADEEGDDVWVLDLWSWLASLADADRRAILPDGVHASDGSSEELWSRFLGPALEERSAVLRPS